MLYCGDAVFFILEDCGPPVLRTRDVLSRIHPSTFSSRIRIQAFFSSWILHEKWNANYPVSCFLCLQEQSLSLSHNKLDSRTEIRKNLSRIQGVKNHRIPDHGSATPWSTLLFSLSFVSLQVIVLSHQIYCFVIIWTKVLLYSIRFSCSKTFTIYTQYIRPRPDYWKSNYNIARQAGSWITVKNNAPVRQYSLQGGPKIHNNFLLFTLAS
jgi:hypothetical protein